MKRMAKNNDGADNNYSWNHGAEGLTDDPEIIELRERQKRNLLSTLIFSQGTPMVLGGDEFGRSQGGNNNVTARTTKSSGLIGTMTREPSASLTLCDT